MTSEATQLVLIPRPHEEFAPVPCGVRHYVAAVQNRSGELDALRMASSETWQHMTPLIQIVGGMQREKPYRRQAVRDWMKRLARSVESRPCFLDTVRLTPEHRTETPQGQ